MTDSSAVAGHPFSTRTLHLVFLLVCGCLLLLLGLGDVGLTDRDEGSNAGAAREMLETGDWISPTLNYEPRYAKPALTYWIIAGTYALFGVNDFTARLPSAVFGLALLVLHYLFLHRVLGPALAFCGSLILLLNVEFVGIHRLVLTDPALVFFTTLATYGFWLGFCDPGRDRRFLWLFYLGMALGTLAKGPLGILIPLLAVVPYLTLTRQWKAYFAEGRPLAGWTLCFLIAAPWYLAMLAIHGADYAAAAQANTTGRFANPMEGHGGTLLFYFPILLLGFFPWSGLLPAALWHVLKEWKSFRMGTADARGEPGLLLFCALWVCGMFLFFTISATRLPHYVLPLFPPAALLVAVLWSRFLKNARPAGLTVSTRLVLVTGYVLSLALVSTPVIYESVRSPHRRTFSGCGTDRRGDGADRVGRRRVSGRGDLSSPCPGGGPPAAGFLGAVGDDGDVSSYPDRVCLAALREIFHQPAPGTGDHRRIQPWATGHAHSLWSKTAVVDVLCQTESSFYQSGRT